MAKIKITKTTVQELPFPEKGQALYWDEELPGFGIRVSQKVKCYFVQMRVKGKSVRAKVGVHGQTFPEAARRTAFMMLGEMAKGVNLNEAKREEILELKREEAKLIPLKTAFDEFMETRKELKKRTRSDYRRLMEKYFSDWLPLPLTKISKDMVLKRHLKIGDGGGGKAQANQAMRVLRAVYNYAIARYDDGIGNPIIYYNPVTILSLTKAWYRVYRKQTLIHVSELPRFLKAIDSLYDGNNRAKTEDFSDCIKFILFTGLRRSEAFNLKWSNVNLSAKTFTVDETKNGQPLSLPLSDYLYSMLEKRHAKRGESDFVFPGVGTEGHIVEPKRQLNKIRELSGLSFTLHDLRRTYITIAESLDIPHYALKNLVNHKISHYGDVTAGYIISNPERLRKPMQKITDYILKQAKQEDARKVISMQGR